MQQAVTSNDIIRPTWLPPWVRFLYETGWQVAEYPCDGTRIFVTLVLPTRSYAPLMLATGIVMAFRIRKLINWFVRASVLTHNTSIYSRTQTGLMFGKIDGTEIFNPSLIFFKENDEIETVDLKSACFHWPVDPVIIPSIPVPPHCFVVGRQGAMSREWEEDVPRFIKVKKHTGKPVSWKKLLEPNVLLLTGRKLVKQDAWNAAEGIAIFDGLTAFESRSRFPHADWLLVVDSTTQVPGQLPVQSVVDQVVSSNGCGLFPLVYSSDVQTPPGIEVFACHLKF